MTPNAIDLAQDKFCLLSKWRHRQF